MANLNLNPGTGGAVLATEQNATAPNENYQIVEIASGAGASFANRLIITPGGAAQIDGSAVRQPVVGPTSSGAALTGNPVRIGAAFNTVQPLVTNGQVVDLQATSHGGLIIASGTDAVHVTVDTAPTTAVTGTFWQATQPISGTVTANAGTGTFAVSGSLTANQGTANSLANAWTTEITDGTNGPAAIKAASTAAIATDKALVVAVSPNNTVAVTGTFWQATQPVSIAAAVDVSDRAARLAGHVTVDNASIAVTGTFWQATQPISGSVSVSNFPATQPVSGTVTANAGTGTFSNQQSNITTDYDTGAGTQTMTMFGIALPASGGAVAGGTSSNPIRTDPTGTTTQPISGTVTANAGTGVFNVRPATPTAADYLPVRLTDGSAFYTASGGTGGNLATAAKGTTAAGNPTSTSVDANTQALHVQLAGTQPSVPVTGTFWQATQPVSLASAVDVSDRSARLVGHVTIDNASLAVTGTFWQATQPVSGTVTSNQGGAPWSENITQIGGATLALGQAAKASSIPVVTASDSIFSASLNMAVDTTQAVSKTLNGSGSVMFQFSGTWTGTIVFELTNDNTNWSNLPAYNVNSLQAANTTTINGSYAINTGGATSIRARCLTVGTGSATVTIVESQSGGWVTLAGALPASVNRIGKVRLVDSVDADLTTAKGTQTGRFVGTQAVQDAGRTAVILNASSIASVTTEALMTIQKNVGGTVTTGVTEYVVTAGKTLRVQLLRRGCRFTTMSTTVTFANTTIKLRQSATTLSTSSALVSADNLSAASNLPTPDTNSEIFDGLEFPGGTHIGFSHVASATTLSQDVTLIAFEY